MKFTKMEGLGNDYVYVNCFQENVENPSALAKKISDRHFGIGSDGLILIKPSKTADFMMEMYNADGSQSEMCGNGIRCVGKYVYDYGLTDKTSITVETLAGIKYLDLKIQHENKINGSQDTGDIKKDNGSNKKSSRVKLVTVDMGAPILAPQDIPVSVDEILKNCTAVNEFPEKVIEADIKETGMIRDCPVRIAGKKWNITCVSMGNPHCVTFINDTDSFPIEEIGPQFETNPIFPNRVNAEFVQIVNRKYAKMRVWERGSGETLACGTGTCASVVAAILNGLTEDEVTVKLLGGELIIKWDRESNKVYMTGPARVVFDGEI
ncbi:MAG: diaminopimelate epimerase [Clostridium sp.]|nr:diaminopimelate epimerase [Clostridium sp.]